jgi:hypothetical protein
MVRTFPIGPERFAKCRLVPEKRGAAQRGRQGDTLKCTVAAGPRRPVRPIARTRSVWRPSVTQ